MPISRSAYDFGKESAGITVVVSRSMSSRRVGSPAELGFGKCAAKIGNVGRVRQSPSVDSVDVWILIEYLLMARK